MYSFVYPGNIGGADGPHTKTCAHITCIQMRKAALEHCHLCGKPLGFGNQVFYSSGAFYHAACHADRVEQRIAWLRDRVVGPAMLADRAEREAYHLRVTSTVLGPAPIPELPSRREQVLARWLRMWLGGWVTNEAFNQNAHGLPTVHSSYTKPNRVHYPVIPYDIKHSAPAGKGGKKKESA